MSYRIAIVDSGSTKGDWVLWGPDVEEVQLSTMGFNPYLVDFEMYREDLWQHPVIKNQHNNIQQLFFFAAGIGNPAKKEQSERMLQGMFPKAALVVDSDLLAAAWACAGNEPAILGILGTGSNACVYDGHRITQLTTSLGWILGDEGSGSHLGKQLLRHFTYGNLPPDLHELFVEKYRLDLPSVLQLLYHTERPNTRIAQYTEFLYQHRSQPFVHDLIIASFKEFVENHLEKFSQFGSLPIHFIGSIAFHFKEELREALGYFDVQPYRIIQKPIQLLKQFIIANKYDNV
ncbi:MAG TPA: hypothetical protein PKY06_08375 [Saprospiraceae bacterium]|nr:hypothetical protein [Saprospiraceae bacterium]